MRSNSETVPWGTRESTPVERTRTWRKPSSEKQESPGFSRGECQSYIFHLMRALEHERGCCRDCKHSHMTADGKYCKWCSVLATHKIDGEGCCDPSNGYNPQPYFDAGFHCGFFERRVSE